MCVIYQTSHTGDGIAAQPHETCLLVYVRYFRIMYASEGGGGEGGRGERGREEGGRREGRREGGRVGERESFVCSSRYICNLSHTRPPAYSAQKSFKHQRGGGEWGGGGGLAGGGWRRDTSGNYNARPKYPRLYGTDGRLGERYSGRDRDRSRDRDRDKDRLSLSSYYASASAYTTHDGHGLALTG
jgi:hypothetical protein